MIWVSSRSRFGSQKLFNGSSLTGGGDVLGQIMVFPGHAQTEAADGCEFSSAVAKKTFLLICRVYKLEWISAEVCQPVAAESENMLRSRPDRYYSSL